MEFSDYEREQYERYRDCPDVEAYYYCRSKEGEKEGEMIRQILDRARRKLKRENKDNNSK